MPGPPPNAHVQATMQHTREMFTGGVNAGSEVNLNTAQPWARELWAKYTAYQRGYIFGMLLSYDEFLGDVEGKMPPKPTREDIETLRESLVEYEAAFGGKTRVLPESANARQWLRALSDYWPDLRHVGEGRDVFDQYPIAGEPVDVSDESL